MRDNFFDRDDIEPIGNWKMRAGLLISLALFYLLGCICAQAQIINSNVTLPTKLTASGVFTGTQENENFLISVNSCSPSAIQTPGGNFLTNAISGCATIPSSGVSNAWTSGVAGWVVNNNACTTCSIFGGHAQGVALFGGAQALANNAIVYGLDTDESDATGQTGNSLYGWENDVTVNNASTHGFGVLMSMRGTAQPSNFPAFEITVPLGTGFFTSGLSCDNKALNNTSPICITLGTRSGISPEPSTDLFFEPTNSGGTVVPLHVYAVVDADGLPRLTSAENYTLASYIKPNVGTFSAITGVITCDSTEEGVQAIFTDPNTTTAGAHITAGGGATTTHVTAVCAYVSSAYGWYVLGPG